MARTSGYTVKAGLDNTQYKNALREIGVESKQYVDNTTKGIKGMDVAIAAAGAALVKFGKDAVDTFKEVEASILNIQYAFENMGASGRAALLETTRDIARGAGVSLVTASEIQSSFVSGGYTAQRAGQVARPVADFVDAIGKEGAAYSDALISANLTTGRDVLELQDIFAAVAPRTRGGIGRGGTELLAQSMGTLTSQAKALDLEDEDVAALISQGSFMGRRATTGINHVRAILEEAMDKDSSFAKRFEETFGEGFTKAVKGKGAKGLVDAFAKAMESWGTADFIGAFSTEEYGAAAEKLVQGGDRLKETVDLAFGADGAASRVVEQYSTTVKSSAGELQGAAESLSSAVGETLAPTIIEFMDAFSTILNDENVITALQDFAEAAALLSEPLRDAIVPMVSLAASLATETQLGGMTLPEIAGLIIPAMLVKKGWDLGKRVLGTGKALTAGRGAAATAAAATKATAAGGTAAGTVTGSLAARTAARVGASTVLPRAVAQAGALAIPGVNVALVAGGLAGGGSTPDALRQERITSPLVGDELRANIAKQLGIEFQKGNEENPWFWDEETRKSGGSKDMIDDLISGHNMLGVRLSEDAADVMKKWLRTGKVGENVIANLLDTVAEQFVVDMKNWEYKASLIYAYDQSRLDTDKGDWQRVQNIDRMLDKLGGIEKNTGDMADCAVGSGGTAYSWLNVQQTAGGG